jgi:hypothetical protein
MLETDANWEPVEVDDLDAAGVLALFELRRVEARAVERSKLRLAYQWCVTHPAVSESGRVVTVGGLPGVLVDDEQLGGEGCPPVAAFAAEPVAAALGVSTQAALKLLADTLDLHHRLPGCWRRVEALEVEPYRARRVAELTHRLSVAAAGLVDAALAPVLHSCSWAAIERAVAHAIAVHHPELVAEREKRGKDAWDVTLTHGQAGEFAGTSWLEATGDTLDLTLLMDRLTGLAADLAAAGDTDSLGARKAKALGLLANDQAQADLLTLLDQTPGEQTSTNRTSGSRKPKTHLYLHLSLLELLGLGADDELVCGAVEKLGPVLMGTIEDWVARSSATITPVIDLNRHWAVDGHEPPALMREQVVLRDRHCVFPFCGTDARACDLDHIDPYVPMSRGGPPGQTSPERLAPLCRRHHRAKTAGRWRYRRRPDDGSYEWHGPHARSYLVTPLGTLQHHPN